MSKIYFPAKSKNSGLLNRITPSAAGWELLEMEAWRLRQGESFKKETSQREAALVVLAGTLRVASDKGEWDRVGRRPSVFAGMPYALYLPRRTSFEVEALSEVAEFALCLAPSEKDFPAKLITPEDVSIEVRGAENATRQINAIIPPGFPCHRLVCVEVFTPGGNWSSYPPHKHDVHREDEEGRVLEGDLEEIYFYKIAKPKGYALQRVYTADRSLDEVAVAYDNDIVLVPEGYHPVSAAYGYDCYYLNFLAGSAQTLAATDDPDYAWVKESWSDPGLPRDPRVPMVTPEMEKR